MYQVDFRYLLRPSSFCHLGYDRVWQILDLCLHLSGLFHSMELS